MGIFDLFIVNPDGSDLRRLTNGGVQEWPSGWLSDGSLLYIVPGRENEYTLYQVDPRSGESKKYSGDAPEATSPDGQHIVTSESTFGDRWLIYISDLDGSNRWLLADAGLWTLTPTWSPDGQWLLAGVSDTDSGSTIGALINPRTCQVIPLPYFKGNFLSWVP
jgi:Tol biopolymer transport system component